MHSGRSSLTSRERHHDAASNCIPSGGKKAPPGHRGAQPAILVKAEVAVSQWVCCEWRCATDRLGRAALGVGQLLVAVVILGGCTTLGPDFVTPEAPVEDGWIAEQEPKVKRETADYGTWWTAFNDPVLDSLIEAARDQNLTLRIAGVRILEARARLGIAVGNQYPQVQDATADYQRFKQSDNFDVTGLGAPEPNDINIYDAGLNVAWELDFWGRFRRGIDLADAALGASIADYDDVLVSLTADVAATYVLIRELQERLVLARENVRLQQRTLEIADVRFRAGAVNELDVQQARALLGDTQASIPDLETRLRQAQDALSVLLGLPPQDLTAELGGVLPIPMPPPEVAVGIPADLVRRRPDIRRAELDAAAQSARIGIAQADLYPTFTLIGTVGLTASNFGDFFEGDSISGLAGPSFQWPILNYGRLTNNVRVQDARFEQSVVNYRNTVLIALREVEDSLVAFVRSQDQVEFLGDSVAASQRAAELSLLQYRNGLVDYTRVLDTQQFLVTQQDRLAASQGGVARNLIAIYRALGGGWETRGANEFVPDETQAAMAARTDWGGLLPSTDLDKAPASGEQVRAVETLFRRPDF